MTKPIRPIRIDGKIAYVPLSGGYEAIIDASDAEFVGKWNWSAWVGTHSVYATRTDKNADGKAVTVRLHRALLGEPCGMQVDHIDRNGLNNTRRNLRVATRSQNMSNQRTRSDSNSGVKGVAWHKSAQKWIVRIRVNGKRHHIGLFETIESASAAYAKASAELHGEFGRVA